MTEQDEGQRVLVVDDEPSIVDAVATSLRYEGFEVEEATTGRAALAIAQERTPDLIVLDVMLPDLDGLEVTRRLRADGMRVPILFLTARDALEDKLAGLTIGGDDYVTKPFALAEIIARVRVILRRTAGDDGDDGILRFADLEMDEGAHEVRRAGDARSSSRPPSSTCCGTSCSTPARCCPRARSSTTCGTTTSAGEANVVETYVSYLRKKLESTARRCIHTVRLVGYVLREPEAG